MPAAIFKDQAAGLVGRQLSFRYHRKSSWLFRGLDISIAPGEAVGLNGPSGTGKSTLAQILAGIIKTVGGEVLFDGEPLPSKGFCPVQYIYQHPQLAVNPRWKGKKIIEEAAPPADDLLKMLEISVGWFNRYPHELSGGELQRLAIARVLSGNPRCLLADELSAMLDPLTQAIIWRTLIEYKKNGMSILVISHDKKMMEKICDRQIEIA